MSVEINHCLGHESHPSSRQGRGATQMESDLRYYLRRAAEERTAAIRSVTPQARERHHQLAQEFAARAQACNLPALQSMSA